MKNELHTLPANRPKWRRTLIVVLAIATVAAACGSDDSQDVAESSILTTEAGGRGDVEFGASLDEWSEAADPAADSGSERKASVAPAGYPEIGWEDLLPPGSSNDEIFARYEDQLAGLDDGSPEADAIYAEMQAEFDASSGEINTELDGSKINLAGFVAPLNNDGDIVTEFLLVPYFGACIHVPAPPANQTVLVKVDKANGLTLDDTWGPVWVAGTLTLDPAVTDLATASYTLTDATSGVYDEYG